MKRILVVSDSHGLTRRLTQIKEKHEADFNIHCGDSELFRDHEVIQPYITVQGNCDRRGEYPDEETVTIDNYTLFATHGHLYGVKTGITNLTYRAVEVDADIICFGHSHIAGTERIDDKIYINPGSIRSPRHIAIKTYALITIDLDHTIAVEFYDIDGNLVDELSKTYNIS